MLWEKSNFHFTFLCKTISSMLNMILIPCVLKGGWIRGPWRPWPQWPAEGWAVPVPGGAGVPAEGQRWGWFYLLSLELEVGGSNVHHRCWWNDSATQNSKCIFHSFLGNPHFTKQESRLSQIGTREGRGHPQITGRMLDYYGNVACFHKYWAHLLSNISLSCPLSLSPLFCRRQRCVIQSWSAASITQSRTWITLWRNGIAWTLKSRGPSKFWTSRSLTLMTSARAWLNSSTNKNEKNGVRLKKETEQSTGLSFVVGEYGQQRRTWSHVLFKHKNHLGCRKVSPCCSSGLYVLAACKQRQQQQQHLYLLVQSNVTLHVAFKGNIQCNKPTFR